MFITMNKSSNGGSSTQAKEFTKI